MLVLGQVHVTAYFNQDEDIGEEDQVFIPCVCTSSGTKRVNLVTVLEFTRNVCTVMNEMLALQCMCRWHGGLW